MLEYEKNHRSIFIIWCAILFGMLVLTAVGYVLSISDLLAPAGGNPDLKKIMFFIAIAFAVLILYLKRLLFIPEKIVSSFIDVSADKQVEKVMAKIRTNYIIVWTLGEAILMVGIFELIFFVQSDSFWIYVIVSLYSVLINYPRKQLILKTMSLIKQ